MGAFTEQPQITRADLPGFPDGVEIGMIWAQTTAGVIGDGDDMPWHLPEDLRHFQATTVGTPVVMGRVSWEALHPKFRPLPGRDNHVITRDPGYDAPGGTVHTTLPEAVLAAGRSAVASGAHTVWILGGGHVYRQCVPVADRVVVTEIACGSPERFRVTAPDMRADADFTVSDGPWLTSERGTALTGEKPVRYRISEFTRKDLT
ncbi:dihydrofolate reductase [Corynebacterium terpenotabidum]|uniref:dihydrofolate reductase n=1 Tax=Corynebacterium terpenotabidum Y-11 TaxID=1200352 RepID=S4XCA9_9CORY|nr:dihydrofolate reductase [Corynebacterium terpenotabidum]AGP30231.1 dihydrofolate reductase [Corynebacterium terpenotabidum Y-11]